ncbi:MAG TPA: 2-keto-4-pentenoate hydratase [Tahibacter sp.]|uniref:2-keto-4-pentenoate hydratase n=1 Tax=Tahibacter sp. TaxID=2056211 RepID=UPI002C9D71A6|nr:2-keto-4-pentenoate hydratase [Tahibacter sp.]HSX58727.1 2-keto-4-pentenoate hydratase [Tahibacter sp.]
MSESLALRADSRIDAVADALVAARRSGRALARFPEALPVDLEYAYRCQDAVIARWPDRVAGWKVGYIAPERRDAGGDPRLVGPIFASHIARPADGSGEFPVIAGGFAAVEAEFVFRLARDIAPRAAAWSVEDAAAEVAALHVGVELAGSPMADINVQGPCAVVADCGNNAGLLLGPEIANWQDCAMEELICSTWIAGELVGRGGAATLAGGPLAALAFALTRNARRGRGFAAGDLITTGAATGIHDIVAGQHATVDFGIHGRLHCRAVARTPA